MAQIVKNKHLALAIIIYLVILFPLYSQNREAVSSANNSSSARNSSKNKNDGSLTQAENLLGLTPAEVFAKLGAPESVYPLRGTTERQDNVIFYYNTNLYIFFFDNRVWQIRCDHRSKKTIFGITLGMDKTEIREVLGEPYYLEDNEDIYLNPAGITRINKGFPLRLRLIYDANNNLYDIYLYRGDF